MFMSAREIRRDYQGLDSDRYDVIRWGLDNDGDDDGIENDRELFDRKFEEADDSGLLDDLTRGRGRKGVENPISLQADPKKTGSLGKPEILGGHHRVAAMEYLRPDELMPVEHFDNPAQARRSLGDRY